MALRLPRLQFSLRTLVIVVVVVAALASWHGARYARYRARLAARTQAAVRGLFFFTHAEGVYLYGPKMLAADKPTWVQRYDEFCFGPTASQYPVCVLSMYEVYHNEETYKKKIFQQVIELHPEVTIVDVSLFKHRPDPNQFHRIAWAIALSDDIKKSHNLAIAMDELTQFPNLRRYFASDPAFFGDSWVTALPEQSGIFELRGHLVVSPRAIRLLLKKAPLLEKFEINDDLLDQDVRAAVEAKYYIQKNGSTILLEAKN